MRRKLMTKARGYAAARERERMVEVLKFQRLWDFRLLEALTWFESRPPEEREAGELMMVKFACSEKIIHWLAQKAHPLNLGGPVYRAVFCGSEVRFTEGEQRLVMRLARRAGWRGPIFEKLRNVEVSKS